jgi:hypothetical protein
MRPSASPAPTDDPDVRFRRGMVTLCVLGLAVLASMVHQAGPLVRWDGWSIASIRWNLWEWYIEDAAISFAYARNWAAGDGLVAFAGGERIEGYSNPLWVALMAFFYLFGIDGFVSSKWMSMVFGGITVVLSYLIAREVIDDEEDPWSPLAAPITLSVMPPFGFWNASGLENSLFNVLLAGGLWRTLVEARKGGFPWSAVFFLGLSVTRPEAIMYAAWAGFLGMVFAIVAGRGMRSTLLWLATFFLPFTAYHLVRYDYFAWAFPNTYYAKLGHKEFKPFAWGARGWKYIRGFGFETGYGWFLPLHIIGLIGLRSTRQILLVSLSVPLIALLFIYPNAEMTQSLEWWPKDLPEPEWWKELRVWGLFAVALLLPLSAIGDRRAHGRVLCWGMAFITLFFCVRSTGDWMKGYRWMSFLAVPASVLFSVGVYECAAAAQRWFGRTEERGWSTPGWLTATVLVLAVMPGFYLHSEWFFKKRETGPFSVQERAEYTASLEERMFLEGRIRNLDVDMGAHTYWSEHLMVDMAGLVDVTIAHHDYSQRAVTKEYVFEEMRPEIAHVHGGWATTSKIPTFAEWKSGYIEVPGFPASKTTYHMGNHVRRDLLMKEAWKGGGERRVNFADGVTLSGFKVPSPEISQGKAMFIEVGFEYRKVRDRQNFRVMAFLSNDKGAVFTFDVPMGYDWLPPDEWKVDEVFVGRFAPLVHRSLEPGMYDLGFVVFGADGVVIPAGQSVDEEGVPVEGEVPEDAVVGGRDGEPARVAVGEVRFPSVLKIGEAGLGEKAAKADRDRALELAAEDRCVDAETAWRMAWRHVPKATSWHVEQGAEVREALSDCWVRKALADASPHDAAVKLDTARYWAYRNPELWAAADQIGQVLYAEGELAREGKDWEAAYKAFSNAVKANPSLSWARRYAEEARDYRLGIDPESVAKQAAEREERVQRLRDQEEVRREAREAQGEGEEAPEAGGAPEAVEGQPAEGEE